MYSPSQMGIHIPRTPYRGSNQSRRQKLNDEDRLCRKIEIKIQEIYDELKSGETRVVISAMVAHDISEYVDKVRNLIYRLDAGSNGVTFFKP